MLYKSSLLAAAKVAATYDQTEPTQPRYAHCVEDDAMSSLALTGSTQPGDLEKTTEKNDDENL